MLHSNNLPLAHLGSPPCQHPCQHLVLCLMCALRLSARELANEASSDFPPVHSYPCPPMPVLTPTAYAAEEVDDEANIDWDAFAIKGTNHALEKSYFRLTSAPDPSTVGLAY